MSELTATEPAATPDPTEPPVEKTSHRVALLIAALIVAVAVTGLVVGLRHNPTQTATQTATGTVCDPTTAVASHDGRDGVAVQVHFPGPSLITVDVVGMRHDRLTQQVTKHWPGARFDFGQDYPVQTITVITQVQDQPSTAQVCTLAPPAGFGQ